jgi:vitamin B12 transporter
MKNFTYRLCAGVATFACSSLSLSLAQTANELDSTPTTQFNTIVVTPTRSPEPLGDTLGDNSVITRETLEMLPNGTLGSALEREHAIGVVDYGGPQTTTTINIRGTNSNQSLILIDGMRLNNATTGLAPLNAIPLNGVERVEIVRGAASSLYGADAIGGVVNIITRQDSERPFAAYANAGVGTYATSQYDTGFSGASNGWSYSLFGGYGQSAGFASTNKANYYYDPNANSYYRSNVGGQLGYKWAPGQTLTVQTLESRVNGGYANGMPYFNNRGIQDLSNNTITSRNVINDTWTSTVKASFNYDNYQTLTAGPDLVASAPPGGQQHFITRQNQYVWQNDLKLSVTQAFTIAIERLEQSVDANLSDSGYPISQFVNYQQTSRYTNSILGIYRGTWGAQSFQASVRDDNNSQYGNFVTGSLSYGYDFDNAWRGTLAGNTGYRAPNFNELYWPVTPYFMGNPLLSPETSRNIEASLRYKTDDTQVALTVYRNQINNLIVNTPLVPGDDYSPYAPSNIGSALITGLTLNGSQQWRSTRVRGSFDWMNPRNMDTGALLPQRAQATVKLAVDQSIEQLKLTGEWLMVGARSDSMSGNMMGAYALLNLFASYPLSKETELQLRWNNVLNKSYTIVQGYNTIGSNVFVNLALRL